MAHHFAIKSRPSRLETLSRSLQRHSERRHQDPDPFDECWLDFAVGIGFRRDLVPSLVCWIVVLHAGHMFARKHCSSHGLNMSCKYQGQIV